MIYKKDTSYTLGLISTNFDTHHYPAYLTGVARFTNGYNVFMPTEFMHGQYDQGHGAGLQDFGTTILVIHCFRRFHVGFCDNAVKRADKGGNT